MTEETSKRVSFEPVDAKGAVITGVLVALVVSLLVGVIVVVDVLTWTTKMPARPRRRRYVFQLDKERRKSRALRTVKLA